MLCFVISWTCSCSLLLGVTAAASEPKSIKFFLLVGQSNMEGKGLASHLDTYKTDPLIRDTYPTLKRNGEWVVREDVLITYPTKRGGAQHGRLTVGYGTKGVNSIGPEFGFGHTVGDALDAPVVLVKLAWGGKRLAVDFRPPSAGLPPETALAASLEKIQKCAPKTTMKQLKARYGHYYRQVVDQAKDSLKNLGTTFPELRGRDYVISGIVWHQGFNDVINRDLRAQRYVDYTGWLACFIRDIRRDLGAPDAPFVIGELSTGGLPNRGDFQRAQKAVAELAEFRASVAFVPTAEYYDTRAHELFRLGLLEGQRSTACRG